MKHDLYTELGYDQYIWNGVMDELRDYISAIPNGDTLDVRKCRFDPGCISVIMNNIPRIDIINSEEPELNYILQHNRKVRLMDRTAVIRKDIQAIFYDEDGKRIDDFIKTLMAEPKTTVWQIPSNASSTKYLNNYFTVMLGLVMQFPKRLFDIHNEMPGHFVSNARKYFSLEDYLNYPSIILSLGSGTFMPMKFDDMEKGELHIGGVGLLAIEDLLSNYNALPGWLGVEKVVGTKRQSILERVYADVKFADRIEADTGVHSIRGYITKYGGL